MSARFEQPRDRRVAFIGDSLVAGVGDPTGMGWVGRVVAASFGLGLLLTAYNLGVRRETSGQVAVRWRSDYGAAHPAAEGYEVLSDIVIAAGWADWLRGE